MEFHDTDELNKLMHQNLWVFINSGLVMSYSGRK
jgi:hypothetical protein